MPKIASDKKQQPARFYRPEYFGKRRSNADDAKHALEGAAIIAREDGYWSDELRKFVDAWLDFLYVEMTTEDIDAKTKPKA
jgi:hypothetical protein